MLVQALNLEGVSHELLVMPLGSSSYDSHDKLWPKDINATGVVFGVTRSRALMDIPGGDNIPNLNDTSIELLALREKVLTG
jgi:hypothetical protein